MPASDLSDVLTAATDYGDRRADAARSELQPQIDAAVAERDAVKAAFDAYKATHPDTPPPAPAPDPEPVPEPAPTGRKPLLGMSAPADVWATRKREVEATGGKLQARRIFLSSLTSSLTLVKAALDEGLYPVVSLKTGSYTWGKIATGAADADLKKLAASLKALGGRVFVCIHHEPATQALGPTKGEGGTAAEYAAMNDRAVDILKAGAPNVDYGVCLNGWMFSDGGRAFTDAQLEVWLPKALRTKLDVIAADDYSPEGGEESVVKTRNRAAWAKRVGSVKALGIGEFNSFNASALANVVIFAKTEPLFRDGFICVWNSTGGTYLPLAETGLLDDFQALLKGWPTN